MKKQNELLLIERIEELEKQVKLLRYAGMMDFNKITIELDPFVPIFQYYSNLHVYYVYNGQIKDFVWREAKSVSDLKCETEVKKNNENEAILKRGDQWLKLDKVNGILIDIPEPAEFAEKKDCKNCELRKDSTDVDISEESKDGSN